MRAVIVLISLVGCKGHSSPAPTPDDAGLVGSIARPSELVLPRLPRAEAQDPTLVASGRTIWASRCASCHRSLWNVGLYKVWFRDGHAASLTAATEEEWRRHGSGIAPIAALEAYERSRVCDATAYDRFAAGDRAALDEPARRGLDLFFGKAGCAACHAPPSFSSATSREVTENVGGDRAYRPPTLRDIARRGPYFHDGSAATLAAAVAIMAAGGGSGSDRNPALVDHHLTPVEQDDLVTFLRALDCPAEDQ